MTPGTALIARPATAWPLSDAMGPLRAVAGTPRWVRTGARRTLAGWDLDHVTDVIDLVATEFVTNAVHASEALLRAGMAPMVRVCLLTDRLVVRIEVWDEAPGLPEPANAADDAESGRGLGIVGALTGGRWGWTQVAALLPAKCVWAEIPLTPLAP